MIRRRLPGAAVLLVGSELLSGRTDTNGPALEAMLAETGLEPKTRVVVGDDEAAIARACNELRVRHAAMIVCGGLGPTQDDVTRQAIAAALGRPLVFVPAAWAAIQARFRRMGREAPDVNRIQAMIPRGAVLLPNARGTASGFLCSAGRTWIAAVPGPPAECLPMCAGQILPLLRRRLRLRGARLVRRTLRVCGLPESTLQELLGPLFRLPDMPDLGFLLDEPGEILVILTQRGLTPARAKVRLDRAEVMARSALGPNYVGGGESTLPAVVGRRLTRARQTLAVAESCTGGLISRRVTSVPGSSGYFLEGAVTYGNAAKVRLAGVPASLIARQGAVSEAVARAMAQGIRRRSGADWGLAVTGIAGPGGGTREKPVGLVWLAISGPGSTLVTRRQRFLGNRDLIQRRSATAALDWLRRRLWGWE